jgi:hypothetical protein
MCLCALCWDMTEVVLAHILNMLPLKLRLCRLTKYMTKNIIEPQKEVAEGQRGDQAADPSISDRLHSMVTSNSSGYRGMRDRDSASAIAVETPQYGVPACAVTCAA